MNDNLHDVFSVQAIERLMADYCHRVDDRDLEAWAALFQDDATLEIRDEQHQGRNAIYTWVQAAIGQSAKASRHLVTNIAIDLQPDDTATCKSDYIVVTSTGSIVAVGRYEDLVVSTAEGWRFRHRVIHLDG